jgi:hypothetical protein
MTLSLRCLLVAGATAAAAGCAHTSMTSTPAPQLWGRSFHTVLVVAQMADLGLRFSMEDRFASRPVVPLGRAASFSTRFVASHTVFLPGHDYTSEQVVEAMRHNGIDATLVITPGETGSTQAYVPPTYTTSCTGYNVTLGCAQTTTTSSGGFSYAAAWTQFAAKLFDAVGGQVAWEATVTSGDIAFAQTSDLVQSMADRTLERLLAGKVIR